MSLYKRLKRRLGYDTTTELTREIPVYHYAIEHTNGDYSKIVGHGYHVDGAFARFYEYTDGYVFSIGGYTLSPCGQHVKRVLESIKEIEKERVGTTELRAVVDTADGTVCEQTINTESEL